VWQMFACRGREGRHEGLQQRKSWEHFRSTDKEVWRKGLITSKVLDHCQCWQQIVVLIYPAPDLCLQVQTPEVEANSWTVLLYFIQPGCHVAAPRGSELSCCARSLEICPQDVQDWVATISGSREGCTVLGRNGREPRGRGSHHLGFGSVAKSVSVLLGLHWFRAIHI